jgi:biotin transport system substrate-specific component
MISAHPASAPRALALRAVLVLAGSAFLALSAQVAVPMFPVPITMQTLAIPLLVLVLGRRLAVAVTLAYLAEGALGLPVFSGWLGGVPRLLGPTAGFLWTFPLAAYLIGMLLERGPDAGYASRWVAVFLGTAVVFAGGAWWLAVGLNLSPWAALEKGVFPFLIGDVLKCTIAAGLGPQWSRLAARLGLEKL